MVPYGFNPAPVFIFTLNVKSLPATLCFLLIVEDLTPLAFVSFETFHPNHVPEYLKLPFLRDP